MCVDAETSPYALDMHPHDDMLMMKYCIFSDDLERDRRSRVLLAALLLSKTYHSIAATGLYGYSLFVYGDRGKDACCGIEVGGARVSLSRFLRWSKIL